MTPEVALEKREQMIEEGFCIVDDVLSEEFLQELRDESERLIAGHVEPEDVIYQGQHVNVRGEDNPYIQKLLEWQPSRDALEQIGFGDFVSSGGIIILTKESDGPPLYWHQDWDALETIRSAARRGPKRFFLIIISPIQTGKNGCLKVIPGTHRKRIDLHDILVPAHEQGARFIDEDHPSYVQRSSCSGRCLCKSRFVGNGRCPYLTLRP